eukprot:402069-Prorocentrum_minimum.AAC.1
MSEHRFIGSGSKPAAAACFGVVAGGGGGFAGGGGKHQAGAGQEDGARAQDRRQGEGQARVPAGPP